MDSIFHEKQEGSLCAQHCLNSLLQGSYFTAVELSSLGQKLDDAERLRMAECGVDSEEYQQFLRQPSGNMDDSGYFSVQVISSALEVWSLEIVPFSSTDQRVASVFNDPCQMQAFICNYKDHWFTIRKLGKQWFNLNSLLKHPQLISDTYLSLFLAQLKNDGYSIFVVVGALPDCEADQVLLLKPAVAPPSGSDHLLNSGAGSSGSDVKLDAELEAALKMSLTELDNDCLDKPSPIRPSATELIYTDEDSDLQRALELSLRTATDRCDEDDEDALLKKAIHMSLEC